MIHITRDSNNPILKPVPKNDWEDLAVFNPSVVKDDGVYHMLYRAMPLSQNISVIGRATSSNGKDFTDRKVLIEPEHDWEQFGCEDPRVTKIDGLYYIFYTALSTNPPNASSIKVAVAISKDLKPISENHHQSVTKLTTFEKRAKPIKTITKKIQDDNLKMLITTPLLKVY